MGGVLKHRWLVFAVALAVRSVVAFLFLGSVDVQNSINDAEELIAGTKPSDLSVPYLPGVQLVIWTAGMLGFHTAIPFGFLFKLPGCLFDSVIAAAIADVRGRRAGLLYAFAPVPIFIFAIHGQWDSISIAPFLLGMLLLRREGNPAAAGAGALAVLSVIAKPITVPFLIFLAERRRLKVLAFGTTLAVAVYGVVMGAIGDPLNIGTLDSIVSYARIGVQHLGLPIGLGFTQNRLPMLVPLLALVPLYATGRIAREDAVTLACAFLLGTCGLSAQYLSWLLPFLLLRGFERFAAFYGVAAGAYLALFYAVGHDGSKGVSWYALSPLRSAAWLAPSFHDAGAKMDFMIAVGNYVLPLACLLFSIFALRRREKPADPEPAALSPLGVALAITFVLFVAALPFARPERKVFERRTEERIREYAIEAPRMRAVDALSISYVWVAAWGAFAIAPHLTAMRARR